MHKAGPPPKWIPAFLGISLLVAPVLMYMTGSVATTLLAVLYFAWWAWTIPQHYHNLTVIPKTPEWASKTSRSLILAVPGLALVFLILCGIGYKAIGYALTAYTTAPTWFAGDVLQALMPYALSLPVVTAAVLWHITIMFGRMVSENTQ